MLRKMSFGSPVLTNTLCTLVSFFFFVLYPFRLLSTNLNIENKNSTLHSLRLSLQKAETLLLDENLLLIAEKLNVDIKDTEIRRARLGENPEIGIEHHIVNGKRNEPAKQLLRVERANAFSEAGIGLVYDRLDGLVDNYFGITLTARFPFGIKIRELYSCRTSIPTT